MPTASVTVYIVAKADSERFALFRIFFAFSFLFAFFFFVSFFI